MILSLYADYHYFYLKKKILCFCLSLLIIKQERSEYKYLSSSIGFWVIYQIFESNRVTIWFALQDEWVLCRIIQKSPGKMKPPQSFQIQTCFQEKLPTPSLPPILHQIPPLPPPALLQQNHQSQIIRFQRHENGGGLESLIMNNPQPQLVYNNHFSINNPPLVDGGAWGSFGVDGGAWGVDVGDSTDLVDCESNDKNNDCQMLC